MCLHKSEMTSLKSLNLQPLNREHRLTPEPTILALMGNLEFSGALNSMTHWQDYLRMESKCLLYHSIPISSIYMSALFEWWITVTEIQGDHVNNQGWIQNSTFAGRIFLSSFKWRCWPGFGFFFLCSFSTSLPKGLSVATALSSGFSPSQPLPTMLPQWLLGSSSNQQ